MSRNILLVTNAQSQTQASLVSDVCQLLSANGLSCLFEPGELSRLESQGAEIESRVEYDSQKLEAVVVLGGDGSILRAAELTFGKNVPILGINTGHVGFMAEAELSGLDAAIAALAQKDYKVRNRVALEVSVMVSGVEVFNSWALNEVTVEKSARERVLEVVMEVDGRPLAAFGCDGVLVSTPTGSTAYAFSAGGPVVWPNVDALLLVPLSAHALFARPLVLGTNTEIAIEVLARSASAGVMWCDGRRSFDLSPGSRVEVYKSDTSIPMIVLSDAPFTDRLVRKFALPVVGWRGPESPN